MKSRYVLHMAALIACLSPFGVSAEVVDGIAAIVNTNAITFSDVRDMVLPVERELRRTYTGQELQDKLKASALDALNTLVERSLIVQDFNSKGYKIPDSVIEERMREIIRQDFGGDKELMIRTISAQGMTMPQYRDKLRNQIIIQVMKQHQVTGEIIISPAKIETYYKDHQDDYKVEDQIKLRLILVKKGVDAEDNVARRKLIDEILSKLSNGEDFAALAKQYSERTAKKENEGESSWIERSTLRKELADIAFTLQPGQHSQVIETDDGYYLLKVEEIRAAHVAPLSEVRDDIEKKLINAEKQRLQQMWIDRLKSRAFIRYY